MSVDSRTGVGLTPLYRTAGLWFLWFLIALLLTNLAVTLFLSATRRAFLLSTTLGHVTTPTTKPPLWSLGTEQEQSKSAVVLLVKRDDSAGFAIPRVIYRSFRNRTRSDRRRCKLKETDFCVFIFFAINSCGLQKSNTHNNSPVVILFTKGATGYNLIVLEQMCALFLFV